MPGSSEPPPLNWIDSADSPFKAWAGVSLLSAQRIDLVERGRRIATDLVDANPTLAALEHADIAAFAVLASISYLSPQQREAALKSLPNPSVPEHIRSSFFGSGAYVYLFARGLGGASVYRSSLASIADEALDSAAEHPGEDFVDAALFFAARSALATGQEDTAAKHTRIRLSAASSSADNRVAAHWLLETQSALWSRSAELGSLREALRSHIEKSGNTGSLPTSRSAVDAMALEIWVKSAPAFKVMSHEEHLAAVARDVGVGRWAFLVVWLIGSSALAVVPMLLGNWTADIPWLARCLAATMIWVPLVVFGSRLTRGRKLRLGVLIPTFLVGAAYYGYAIYAGINKDASALVHVQSETVGVGILQTLIAIFGGGQGRTRAPNALRESSN